MLSLKDMELEELKKSIVKEVKNELLFEFKKVKELEAKIIEFSKLIDALSSEVLYLKSELKKMDESKETRKEDRVLEDRRVAKERVIEKRVDDEDVELLTAEEKKTREDEDDGIIYCD
ncbi:hypothetical protein Asulf_00766 [Archaeoglobus sulfaticallidus PM70-1]|uniref:Uncharacterized protein n=1 Tax=Archaeoglobus sulfaticallidus PM70-1 TaxID=387631 RepID=N0BAZ4_9EURY|nr:hypothetical protein [Archaeoglobus sulfaticallidus]AGK60779.1 hypothetical protein Asulf_00766 [Archaeoglobus sulfaticallidus PM70-1]